VREAASSRDPFASLLEPLPLGERTAPSRVLFGPHVTNLGRGRSLSDRHVAYYERRAVAGCGVVVIETASVHDSDWPYERAPLAAACADGWRTTAHACRDAGAITLASIGHAGGQGSSAFSRGPLWAPSGVAEVNAREMPKVMEDDEIAAVIHGFGAAARLAAESGLDGVEVNAGQHSLVRQFLSGLTNSRGDGWGTDRVSFARAVLGAAREGVEDGLVGLRLCIDELAPWAGITPDSAVAIAQELAPHVDYLVLVRGSIYSVTATRPDGHEQPGFNLPATAAIRASLDGIVPVFAQGSIVDPLMAAAAIADGTADGVEMTRAQIADAELVRKLREDAAERLRPCVLCNQECQVLDGRNPIVTCIGDPRSGHETVDPADGADPAEPIALRIVGGGPAGLEAARVAAVRGHRVTLVEATGALGGRLRTAARAPGRERLAHLVDWLEAECRRLGVEIRLGEKAPQTDAHKGAGTETEGETATIFCPGSVDGEPTYVIAEDADVISAAALLERNETPAGPVVVWDPIGGPIGISCAELLAGAGVETALVTPDPIAGTLLSLSGDLVAANARLRRAGVTVVRRAVLRRVGPGLVTVEDRFGAGPRELPAAMLVDAAPRLPAPGRDAPGWVRAGDAIAPRTVLEAMIEARRAVRTVERALRPLAARR
jgi:mycofactocin system FadH/OYE family oxidoreductase 1